MNRRDLMLGLVGSAFAAPALTEESIEKTCEMLLRNGTKIRLVPDSAAALTGFGDAAIRAGRGWGKQLTATCHPMRSADFRAVVLDSLNEEFERLWLAENPDWEMVLSESSLETMEIDT